MMRRYCRPVLFSPLRAFSLLELSIVLLLIGLVSGVALKTLEASKHGDCYVKTREQITKLHSAFEAFRMQNDRFPRPARRWVGAQHMNSGKEVGTADLGQIDSYTNPSGPQNAGTVVLFGALPWSSLAISPELGVDCWGNKLTYAVTQGLTEKDFPDTTKGAITILQNNSLVTHGYNNLGEEAGNGPAGYAIISHGEDELGAVEENFERLDAFNDTSKRKWCNRLTPPPITLREQNCFTNNSAIVETAINNGEKDADNYFDDIVTYRTPPWRNRVSSCTCGSKPGPIDVYSASPDVDLYTANPICD